MSYLIISFFLTIAAWSFAYMVWFNIGDEGENMIISMGLSTLSLVFYYSWMGDFVLLFLLENLPKGGENFLAGVIFLLVWILWITLPLAFQFLFMNKDGEVAIKNFLALFK